jgi:hypothetical protein
MSPRNEPLAFQPLSPRGLRAEAGSTFFRVD